MHGSNLNLALRDLAAYARAGWSMDTVNQYGHKSVRIMMDRVFLADLPHQEATDAVLNAIF